MLGFISINKIESILGLFIRTTIFNVGSEAGHRFSIKMRHILANFFLEAQASIVKFPKLHF